MRVNTAIAYSNYKLKRQINRLLAKMDKICAVRVHHLLGRVIKRLARRKRLSSTPISCSIGGFYSCELEGTRGCVRLLQVVQFT